MADGMNMFHFTHPSWTENKKNILEKPLKNPKGDYIVLMDEVDYVKECCQQRSNETSYNKHGGDPRQLQETIISQSHCLSGKI